MGYQVGLEPNGGDCNHNSDCASGWCCAGGQPHCPNYHGGKCADKVGPGELCCFDAQCSSGSGCSGQCNDGYWGYCNGAKAAVGASCSSNSDCASGECCTDWGIPVVPQSYCFPAGTC